MMYHSIHYMDAIRYLMGTPEYVFADIATYPGQGPKGETRSHIFMKFPSLGRGMIHDTHNNISPTMDDWYATYRVEGTDGIAKGTNGSLYSLLLETYQR